MQKENFVFRNAVFDDFGPVGNGILPLAVFWNSVVGPLSSAADENGFHLSVFQPELNRIAGGEIARGAVGLHIVDVGPPQGADQSRSTVLEVEDDGVGRQFRGGGVGGGIGNFAINGAGLLFRQQPVDFAAFEKQSQAFRPDIRLVVPPAGGFGQDQFFLRAPEDRFLGKGEDRSAFDAHRIGGDPFFFIPEKFQLFRPDEGGFRPAPLGGGEQPHFRLFVNQKIFFLPLVAPAPSEQNRFFLQILVAHPAVGPALPGAGVVAHRVGREIIFRVADFYPSDQHHPFRFLLPAGGVC